MEIEDGEDELMALDEEESELLAEQLTILARIEEIKQEKKEKALLIAKLTAELVE